MPAMPNEKATSEHDHDHDHDHHDHEHDHDDDEGAAVVEMILTNQEKILGNQKTIAETRKL